MNNVSKITSMGMCVGCGSCNICEHISLKENELGFPAPVVDEGCINCGKCSKICPQGIDIPAQMQEFTETLAKLPTWESICHQRDEEQIKR